MDIFLIAILSLIIPIIAQIFVTSSYSHYKRVPNEEGKTGSEIARWILDKNGLSDIYVVETKGNLTDHYDPKRKVIRLSNDIYNGKTIASASVAAHEVGHAIQDKDGYKFLRIRHALVPIVNISSYAGYIAFMIGLLFGSPDIAWIGIILLSFIVIFELVTLPVEFNASKRALVQLEKISGFKKSAKEKCGKMLLAAALTYVASLVSSLLNILRLALILNDRD